MFIIRVYEEGNRWNHIFLGGTEIEVKRELASFLRDLWDGQGLNDELGPPSEDSNELIREFFQFWTPEFSWDMLNIPIEGEK